MSTKWMPYPVVVSLVVLNVAAASLVPIAFPNQYPGHPEAFGANAVVFTLEGQWWRLLTSNFVHVAVFHLALNMCVLWVLGKRLERAWGHWTFLLTYLTCGLVGGMTDLAFYPQYETYGASACVVGVAGAVIVIYSLRFRTLSGRAKCRLLALILFIVALIWSELSGKGYVGHTPGLLTGIALAFFFAYFAKTPRARYSTFAGMVVLLTIAGTLIRQHYLATGLIH